MDAEQGKEKEDVTKHLPSVNTCGAFPVLLSTDFKLAYIFKKDTEDVSV
jgi:hypothetical protein